MGSFKTQSSVKYAVILSVTDVCQCKYPNPLSTWSESVLIYRQSKLCDCGDSYVECNKYLKNKLV